MVIALSGAMFAACNSDDSSYELIEDTTVSNVSITSFSLGSNDKIVANLDSLFFTIDLKNGRVFNADSLPAGTVLGNALVSIEHPTVSALELIFKDAEGNSKTVDYLKEGTDSVYFGNGTVTLRVVSASGNVMREYGVDVNVHKVKPDSLYWDTKSFSALPTSLTAPSAQRTVKYKDKYCTLAGKGTSFTLASSDDIASAGWTVKNVTLPADADVNSFTATDNSLFILAGATLYSSPDGETWTSTGVGMNHIYGAYLSSVVGVKKKDDGTYVHVSYPSSAEIAVPASCPVSGTSDVIIYESEWSVNPMLIFTGGRKADGNLTGATWAYDGSEWAQISAQNLPALEGLAIVPYQTMNINNQWVQTFTPVLLAMGGKAQDGTIDKTVYMSYDRGVHWTTAPLFMQPAANAKMLTGFQIMAESSWLGNEASRAVAPITRWECPFLYVFGGYNASGNLNAEIWRGALNAFRIKPIQ